MKNNSVVNFNGVMNPVLSCMLTMAEFVFGDRVEKDIVMILLEEEYMDVEDLSMCGVKFGMMDVHLFRYYTIMLMVNGIVKC